MKHLRLTNIFYLGLLFSVALVTSCAKNPVGINLNEEADFIPWELISGKIAYRHTSISSDNTVKSSEIIVIDGDERTVKSITKDNSLTFHELAWAKDGEKFVYSDLKLDRGKWELQELNMSSEEQKHIYPSEWHCNYPSYSYNERLAYTNGWVNILIDGEVFYRGDVNATPPSWSPDGNYIVASISDSTSQGALYKISLNDTTKVPLLQGKGAYNNEIFSDPSFSPDGRKIAYVKWSSDLSTSSLWLMDASGYNQKKLTNGPGDWHSEWSPDGKRILFERDSHLFIINIDGSGLTQVTKSRSPYHEQFPEWI